MLSISCNSESVASSSTSRSSGSKLPAASDPNIYIYNRRSNQPPDSRIKGKKCIYSKGNAPSALPEMEAAARGDLRASLRHELLRICKFPLQSGKEKALVFEIIQKEEER